MAPSNQDNSNSFVKKLFTKAWAECRETTTHGAEPQISKRGSITTLKPLGADEGMILWKLGRQRGLWGGLPYLSRDLWVQLTLGDPIHREETWRLNTPTSPHSPYSFPPISCQQQTQLGARGPRARCHLPMGSVGTKQGGECKLPQEGHLAKASCTRGKSKPRAFRGHVVMMGWGRNEDHGEFKVQLWWVCGRMSSSSTLSLASMFSYLVDQKKSLVLCQRFLKNVI